MKATNYVLLSLATLMRAIHGQDLDGPSLQRPHRPHIVLLVLDDIGWADVGYHHSNIPTPRIDALVKESVELDRAYAMPQCSPTRAAIMTGRWSWTTGLQHFNTIMPGATAGIPKGTTTIAEIMREAGYDTHAIGKWHLGYSSQDQTPMGKGFNSYLGYLQGQTDYYSHTLPSCGKQICLFRNNCKGKMSNLQCSEPEVSPYGRQADGEDFWDGNKLSLRTLGKYTQHSYMERFEELLQPYNTSQAKLSPLKPLFVYFAQQLTHIPLQVPDSPRHLAACHNVIGGTSIVNRTILCSMASQLDESIGRIVDLMKSYGLYDNTVLWAYSDNGGMTQWGNDFPASGSSNWPNRGGKTTLFEGGVRSVSWVSGGALPASCRGTKRKELIHAVDMLPTLAGLAGLPRSDLPSGLSGEDVWGTIVGAEGFVIQRTELPLNIAMNRDLNILGIPDILQRHPFETNYSSLIQWPWKLIMGSTYIPAGQSEDRPRSGWWSIGEYKYTPPPVEENSAGGILLFNLESDPSEQKSVAQQFPEVVSNMSRRVKDWWLSAKSGYVRPQLNLPRPMANPRFHNWSWAPFWHLEGEALIV